MGWGLSGVFCRVFYVTPTDTGSISHRFAAYLPGSTMFAVGDTAAKSPILSL
jgi:hypothetical protein